ncbi:MAG: cytochrome C [Ignavibacteriaceae bacterium]|nr:cytochrome C [Ignavibacteriaceae bacterium]
MRLNIFKSFTYFFSFIALFSFRISAQISPGDLTNAHTNLEGISNCTKCHELGQQVNNSKCLDCHTEIKSRINSGSGYHSSSEVKGKNCSGCHSEHHGRNFRIVNFNPNNFDHKKTGFSLTGKHSQADCKECHKSDFISDNNLKKRKNTYLGLSENCIPCHEDYHQKTLGVNCSSCHNTETFKPAAKFDHSTAAFKLTGAHQKVECIGCHKIEMKNGKEFQTFKGIPFQNCISCHKDVHNGSFGQNCSSCHVTSSFKQINSAAFDHSRTKFPLVGKHKLVSCNNCHRAPSGFKMKFDLCTDCHTDFHKAQFVVENRTQTCSDCHNENGFRPSTFTIERHNKSKFQITGAHLATPCESCHYQQNTWHFKGTGIDCVSCHENIHINELKSEYLPENKCSVCHRTESWNTISFDHNQTNFPLQGKHSSAGCGNCHRKEIDNTIKIIFKSVRKECESCHKDIHFGQFKVEGISDCSRCHSFENWKPEKFDHNKTKFNLEGAHKNIECSKCHPQIEMSSNTFIKFKLEDFKCAACHKK